VSESSAASGVRRIEALTGEGAYEYELDEARRLKEIAALLKSSPREVVAAVERLQDALKEERRKREKAEQAAISGAGAEEAPTVDLGGVLLWRRNFGEVDPKLAASALDNEVAKNPALVALAAVVANGKVTFSCKVGSAAVAKGAHAGNLIREVAKIAGGGGGGRPDFATAGGRDVAKTDEALTQAETILRGMLS